MEESSVDTGLNLARGRLAENPTFNLPAGGLLSL
jgi:hypothetical protein